MKYFSSSTAAVKETPADTSSETSESGNNNDIQPFEYKPSVTETVKMLRKLAQKLDAGRPDFIPRGSNSTEKIPTPAVGYWRQEGFTTFFVEVEPRPDGSREIEIELKWSDDKSKVSDEPSNISMGELTVLLRTLANALNSGAPRVLRTGAKQIDIPSTHGGAEVSVEYEVEDGTHELEIKVAI